MAPSHKRLIHGQPKRLCRLHQLLVTWLLLLLLLLQLLLELLQLLLLLLLQLVLLLLLGRLVLLLLWRRGIPLRLRQLGQCARERRHDLQNH